MPPPGGGVSLRLWADSSPQLSYDFLVTAMLCVCDSELSDVFLNARRLAGLRYDNDADMDSNDAVVRGRSELAERLCAS
eukprot:8173493-Alexandrium_andersonii.AAC.1